MISKYFKRDEFACRCGCKFATVDVELLAVLEDLREHFKSPVYINSGCRCPARNFEIGGSDGSKHTQGIAVDFRIKDVCPDTVTDYLFEKYPDKYGIGQYRGRTHIDVRKSKARWDKRKDGK